MKTLRIMLMALVASLALTAPTYARSGYRPSHRNRRVVVMTVPVPQTRLQQHLHQHFEPLNRINQNFTSSITIRREPVVIYQAPTHRQACHCRLRGMTPLPECRRNRCARAW